MTSDPTREHVHEWTTSNVFPEDETSRSPVSHMDDQVRTNQMAVRSCSCGQMQRVLVSYGSWRWLNRSTP